MDRCTDGPSDHARRQVLEWGTGEPADVPDTTLAGLIGRVAATRRDAVAVVHGSTRLTYRELDAAAAGLALRLRAAGARPEVAVGVSVPRNPLMVVALLAVLKSGAYYLPLDPSLPTARLGLMLADAAPVACVVDKATCDLLPRGPWRLIDASTACAPASQDPAPLDPARPDQLAYVIFTSGSTGRPKGVCVEHRSVVDLVVNSAAAYRAGPDDRMLSFASIGFDISVAEIFTALAVGATLVIADEEDRLSPDRLQALLVRERVTIAEVPPAMLGLLDPVELPDLRLMIVGGEAPPARQVARWVAAGPRVINAYGPTETTVTATMMECTAQPLANVPIGRPMANHRVYLLDEAGQLVAQGVDGELWVSGPGVARGYLGLPGRTADRFVADPFVANARMYRTGDRVRWRADGTLEFLGRIDEQLNLRGHRIEPAEVEARLRAHPGVRAAAVATAPVAGVPQLVGYIVAAGQAPTGGELAEWCARELPAAFVPSSFVFLDALPLNSNGKLDRAALPAPLRDTGRVVAAPRTAAEARLRDIWAQLLPGIPIGVDDDFFDLGGHSLLAMRLLSRVGRAYGVALEPGAIYRARTIAALAAEIAALPSSGGDGAAVTAVPVRRPAGVPAALSYAQRQLWFVERLSPGGVTYNLPIGLRLHGRIDPDALALALADVAARHETLRCSIAVREDEPVPQIAAPAPVRLAVDDLRDLAAAQREMALGRIAATDATTPFVLSAAPLWRARLVRIGEEDWGLVLVAHHAIADGWSLSLLLEELGQHYAARVGAAEGTVPPPPPLQYGDFAWWQQRHLSGESLASALEFWRTALVGAPATLDLPADRPRPAVQTYTPGRVRQALPAGLAGRVRELAATHQVTPFVVLLALFQVLVGRLCGSQDVVVACPVAGRPEPEFESVIGMFVNTVPVRVDLSGDPTLTQVLERTGAAALAAFGHADVPFSLIVEAVHPPRDLSRAPIAQVAFNLLNYPPERLTLPGVKVESITIDPPGSLLDLTLYVHESGRDLLFEAVYNGDLFDRARIDALLDQYVHLIGQADGPAPVASLSLVTTAARRVLPDPSVPLRARTGPTVVDRFRRQARRTPAAPAVEGPDLTLTYAELDAASDRVAAYLAAHGVPAGALVAVPAIRAARLAVAIMGVFKAGAVVCLLESQHPPTRLVSLASDVAPRAWLAVDDSPMPAAICAYLHGSDLACRATVPGVLAAPESAPVPAGPAVDDPAHLLFTSGSTGTPNAVLAAHAPLAHFVDWYAERFHLGCRDRFAVASGVAHDPLLRDLIVPLCVGATACVPSPQVHQAPDELVRWLHAARVTVAHLAPQLARLLTMVSRPAGGLPGLRLLATGGDLLWRADARALAALAPAAELVAFYGATETPQAVAWQPVADDPDRVQVPIGTGIPDVQLLVCTARGAQAGIGELGEIVVRSPYLALGYLGDPKLTAERFTSPAMGCRADDGSDHRNGDRGYHTGDLGRYLPDGRVEFAGRRDGQVKVRGHRVELGEVMSVLQRHAQVRQALVVAVDEPDGDRRLLAYAVPAAGARPRADDLRRHLSVWLPAHAVPSVVVLVERIPLSPNGKADLAALPQPRGRGAAGGTHRPPRSHTEQAIAQVWRDVLRIGVVGLDDNFFDLGGTSLSLVRIQRGLTAALRISVTIVDLFTYPTVRALAARLSLDSAPAAAACATATAEGIATWSAGGADARRARRARRANETAGRR